MTANVRRTVHLVAPASLDDPARPSGGNVYDRRVAAHLAAAGWTVRVHLAPGAWPMPAPDDRASLDRLLGSVPGEVVLVDGLVASAAPEVVARHCASLRVVVLVHQPLGLVSPDRRSGEAALLGSAAAVVATSAWSRHWLLDEYDVPADRVVVAEPGADPADVAAGSPDGGSLLCVGAVTPDKGHDVLVDALSRVAVPWRCTVAGSLDVDEAFAREIDQRAAGLEGRFDLVGPLDAAALDAAYLAADVLVLASRTETYGMVVTEALAHGLPVIGSAVGGTPEALGRASDATVPGILVPAGDATALAGALDAWLGDPGLRAGLRAAALDRRAALPCWTGTATRIEEVLRG